MKLLGFIAVATFPTLIEYVEMLDYCMFDYVSSAFACHRQFWI